MKLRRMLSAFGSEYWYFLGVTSQQAPFLLRSLVARPESLLYGDRKRKGDREVWRWGVPWCCCEVTAKAWWWGSGWLWLTLGWVVDLNDLRTLKGGVTRFVSEVW